MIIPLLAALATLAPLGDVDFAKLGRERADFGKVEAPKEYRKLFRSVISVETILFPEGRSDVRYHLEEFEDGGNFLASYSKVRGNVKLDWVILLAKPNNDQTKFPTTPNMGTLTAYLCGRGLKPPTQMPHATTSALAAHKGFASYGYSFPWEYARCSFVYAGGEEPETDAPSFPISYETWPKTKVAYVITKAEKLRLK